MDSHRQPCSENAREAGRRIGVALNSGPTNRVWQREHVIFLVMTARFGARLNVRRIAQIRANGRDSRIRFYGRSKAMATRAYIRDRSRRIWTNLPLNREVVLLCVRKAIPDVDAGRTRNRFEERPIDVLVPYRRDREWEVLSVNLASH